MFSLPDRARRGSAVARSTGIRSCAAVAPQHTSIDSGTARPPCFPGGGNKTCGADVHPFNAFDTFGPHTKKNPRRMMPSRVLRRSAIARGT
ncbi:hypothetical protein EGT47_08920 [Burkholderia cenocepacia]|nr:hypothetical protein EGT47_08920 [Burkholderia cenocepacia]